MTGKEEVYHLADQDYHQIKDKEERLALVERDPSKLKNLINYYMQRRRDLYLQQLLTPLATASSKESKRSMATTAGNTYLGHALTSKNETHLKEEKEIKTLKESVDTIKSDLEKLVKDHESSKREYSKEKAIEKDSSPIESNAQTCTHS
jgi:hypothetical protein